jgi:large repetitive protein
MSTDEPPDPPESEDKPSEDKPAEDSEEKAPITERDPATIEAVSPERGPVIGGTRVTVTGTGFVEGCKIEVDGVEIPAERVSDTELTFVTPPRVNGGKAPVIVIVGDHKTEPAFFEFIKPEAPQIVSIAPSSGPLTGGTELSIAGLHFVDGARVLVGDIEATVAFEAALLLRATVPPRINAGKVDVRVELPDGQSVLAKEAFEYERARPPKIASVEPMRGPATGNTRMIIEGEGFAPGCTVDVGGALVTPEHDGDKLVVLTPKRATGGSVYVSVTNPDGQVDVRSDAFEYDEPRDPPVIDDLWPRRGAPEKPARINIEGKGFELPCRIEVGGVRCDVEQLDARNIVAIVPGRPAIGDVDVVLTNPDGQSFTLKNGFCWAPPAIEPAIASVVPARGPLLGGTQIVLTGAGLDDKTYVQILDQVVIAEVVGEGRLTLKTPRAPTPGPVDIRVINNEGGSCTVESGFTYELLEPPSVITVTPAKGPITGGTVITLEGSGFVGETAVFVDRGTRPQRLDVHSATKITLTMPAGERASFVDLRLVNPDGQIAIRAKAFQYEAIPAPSIERWDPKFGSANGGWKLTIEGKNFAAGCGVTVGGVHAKFVKRIDDKNLEATIAAFEPNTYADIVVKNPDGQAATAKNAIQVTRR